MSALAQIPLSLQTHHKFRKNFAPKSADFLIWRTPLVRKMSALDKPPYSVTADVFYGRCLIKSTFNPDFSISIFWNVIYFKEERAMFESASFTPNYNCRSCTTRCLNIVTITNLTVFVCISKQLHKSTYRQITKMRHLCKNIDCDF